VVREAFSEREGRYQGTVQTQSGLFAVMERGPGLVIGRVSKAPNIAIGTAISFDPAKGLVKDLGQALGRDFGLALDRWGQIHRRTPTGIGGDRLFWVQCGSEDLRWKRRIKSGRRR
jgi:hypothetical protein